MEEILLGQLSRLVEDVKSAAARGHDAHHTGYGLRKMTVMPVVTRSSA
jgi:hypothetical protein